VIAAKIRRYASHPDLTNEILRGAREFCLGHTRTQQIRRLVDFIEDALPERA
jgi:hypothetical protein